MSDPLVRGPLMEMDLDDDLRRLLKAATVKVRLALLEKSLSALSRRRSCKVELGKITVTADVFQVRALSRSFVIDPSPQVRRRLARRIMDLDWEERLSLLARLLRDPDPNVRKISERNLLTLGPVLASRQALRSPEPRLNLALSRRTRAGVVPVLDRARGTFLSQELELPGDQPLVAGWRQEPSHERGATPQVTEEVVRRFTACDFRGNPQRPAAGEVTFALRIQPVGPDSWPVDLRVPAGKDAVTVLVHAFSSQFTVGPEVWVVKVPRAADSDVASFTVQADQPGEGEVGLLVYDEYRLIGSLALKLRAVDTPQGLTLEKAGTVVFRDPAPASPMASTGITMQVSLAGGDGGRIAFHLLLPLAEANGWQPSLFPLGRSADPLQADGIQSALAALRSAVDEIEQGLVNPAVLGAASVEEALQGIRLNLEGAGRQITEDILSPVVREVLASLRPGSVVHWVIRDSSLDAIPWELAWSPATGHPFNQDLVLIRVPVRDDPDQGVGGSVLPSAPTLPPAPDRLLYVLGANVAGPQQFPAVRKVVQSVGGYEVVTNFDGGKRQPVGVLQLKEQIQGAKLIHLLCHGIVEKDKGLYLEIEENVLGRLTPLHVRGFHLPPNAVVFVNACSSAAATFSLAGLKTFGWSFLRAGARAYIGTLAPVTTRLALRFAQTLLEGHLARKLPLTQAMFEARQQCVGETDPTWLLYTLYGDLSEAPQHKE
ncbi:MAG TPA: CHAT domain-containing protein [Thermoanaerobaculia bacterium]|jgi:hypothetical protein|nr:CHAT domain-containing protein [Thermoanaerobaculia bacterium]